MLRVDDIAIPVLGISILGYLAVRIARWFAVADVDAVAVGLLASFAALSVAATILSIPHLLNGATWVACLAMVTAGTLVIAPQQPRRTGRSTTLVAFQAACGRVTTSSCCCPNVRGLDAVRITSREI
jgi:hypothetical protein